MVFVVLSICLFFLVFFGHLFPNCIRLYYFVQFLFRFCSSSPAHLHPSVCVNERDARDAVPNQQLEGVDGLGKERGVESSGGGRRLA
jgi:hypothetical protein